jgi:hypothetical protein
MDRRRRWAEHGRAKVKRAREKQKQSTEYPAEKIVIMICASDIQASSLLSLT